MKVLVTGASGFVGSNLVHVLRWHRLEVLTPGHAELDLTDAAAVPDWVGDVRPDAMVHAAIWNDPANLLTDPARAWDGYIGAARAVVDAANAARAHVVLVSTDWVFDGTQAPASETTPARPINAYGFLKAASEFEVTLRAARGTVVRIAAVQGIHRARPSTPRTQDAGFGYLAASAVEALRAGRSFTVWEDPRINHLATPVLASHAAELILRALEREVTGTLHCVGSEHCDRVTIARRAATAFGLDPGLIATGPPDPGVFASGAIPYDTRLDARRTAALLEVELPDLQATLTGLCRELESAWSPT